MQTDSCEGSKYMTAKQYSKYYNSINNNYFNKRTDDYNYNENTNNRRCFALPRDELDYQINGDLYKKISMQRMKESLNYEASLRLAKREAEDYHEKFKQLEIENARLEARLASERRSTDDYDSQTQCCICMSERKDHVFVQCGHMATCGNCSMQCENVCPICRTYSHTVAKVFY
jgi:hypothetical protein